MEHMHLSIINYTGIFSSPRWKKREIANFQTYSPTFKLCAEAVWLVIGCIGSPDVQRLSRLSSEILASMSIFENGIGGDCIQE
jgi:hypothetical protein